MCMIAGYIGPNGASEILLEMTRKQEGIFGGFSTGIVTVDAGNLRRARVVGSAQTFDEEICKADIPGNIGIAHSRTNDGGGIEWAHPRLDSDSCLASVGVGIGGCFPSRELLLRLADQLVRDDQQFSTRTIDGRKNGILLPDGSTVHGGEIFLHALARRYQVCASLISAVRDLNVRSETIGMYVSSAEPDRIYIVNHNQRLLISKKGQETFLATSRRALPKDFDWEFQISMNTFAVVSASSVHLEQLWQDEPKFYFDTLPGTKERVQSFIEKEQSVTYWDIVSKALDPMFPTDSATRISILGHELIEQLLAEGAIHAETKQVTGLDGQRVPQLVFHAR